MKEKNNISKIFFHSPKPSPLEMTLSSSNTKDIIKDHHKNLTLHPLVENPNSFAGSNVRSEKDNSIIFQEIKTKPGARQTNNFTNNLTEQKDTRNKDRSEHSGKKISKEQQQQQPQHHHHQQQQQQKQQQSNTLQSNSKEKPSNDTVNDMSTNNMNKKVFIIEDRMIKKVDGYLLTNSIKHKYLVKVRPFLVAEAVDMFDYIKPIQSDFDQDAYILHTGTNDLTTDKKPDEICSEISELVKVLKTNKNEIIISNIVPRGDACNTKVEKVNSLLKQFCENNGIDLILHDNINAKRHLNEGKLHLNDTGISRFVTTSRDFLNIFETA